MTDLSQLVPEFLEPFQKLLASITEKGFSARVTFALRSPKEQARLWRQSRTRRVIEDKIQMLERAGADYLAECLHIVGPQHGPHVTDAIPGHSWHQYGEAADVLLHDGNRLLIDGDDPAYKLLATEAQRQGLHTGITWGDSGHVQLSNLSKPRYSLSEINEMMKARFNSGKD